VPINADHQQRGFFVPVAIAPFWHKQATPLPSGYGRRYVFKELK